jgi:transcriptional regulator with XRE-family HTH domain
MTAGGMKPSEFTLGLGLRLRQTRMRLGLSLPAVAARSHGRWKAVVVGSYERGDRCITAERLVGLARFYDVSAAWLLTGVGQGCVGGPALAENLFAYLASLPYEELDDLTQRATRAAEYGPLDGVMSA